MGGLELLTWLVAGLAIGGAYVFFERSQHFPRAMPILAGVLGGYCGGWLAVLLSPETLDTNTYRPLFLGIAIVGAALFVLGYHLYRVSTAPRTQ